MAETSATSISSPSVPAQDPGPKKRQRAPGQLASQAASALPAPPPPVELSASGASAAMAAPSELRPSPSSVIEQLRRRMLHPDNTVHYSVRQQQLNSLMRIMDQISRKIGKDNADQRAMLSGLYELILVIAERFVLLTHGIMQLDAMNHASSLPAIREARKKFKQVADVQSARQAQEHLDVSGTLRLLAELSRCSLD